MEGLDQATCLRSILLAIDQSCPDEVAFGHHCCERGVVFRANALYAADGSEAGGGESNGEVDARCALRDPSNSSGPGTG